jgi:hypothetical protein
MLREEEVRTQKKAKKSNGLVLFDVLQTKANPVKSHAGLVQPIKGFHSNAARWNESLAPKTFVYKIKKKKKLSIFKKKMLKVWFSADS